MLPYGMISEVENMYSSYTQRIADIEKYAYEKQLYIPYNILDNEKIGLWSSLHTASKKYWSFLIPSKKNQEELDELVIKVRWVLLCDFTISQTCFVDRIASFENELISEQQVKEFIKNCGIWDELAEDIYEWLEDEDWLKVCVEYFEKDRRHVSKEAIEYLQLEEA